MKKILLTLFVLTGLVLLTGCDNTAQGDYTPGSYYAVDPQTRVSVYINVDADGVIDNVLFDQPHGFSTMQSLGDDYELPSGHSWRDEARFLASYLTLHQGWENIVLDVTDVSGMNASTVPDSFAAIDYAESDEGLLYFTMPVDGFVLAWNLAIAQASEAGTAGVVAGVPTAEEWLLANKPPYTYADGIYYGADEDHGYTVRVVIEDGFIVDVVFDAITAINTRIVWNDNGTPADESDDYPVVEIVSLTTKQALQDGLVMVSGVPWYVEAELMRAAILDKQTWDPNWAFLESGSHKYFNMLDPFTLDGVAGVTMAVEGFQSTFEEAIQQAIVD